MGIEVERSYLFWEDDFAIIREKWEFLWEKEIYDEYKDTVDYTLSKWAFFLRSRNGKMDLKIPVKETRPCDVYEELEGENEVRKALEKYWYDYDAADKIVFIVDKKRESYSFKYREYNIKVDVDFCSAADNYEVEIIVDSKEKTARALEVIEEFRAEIWLTWKEAKVNIFLECCKAQAPDLYDFFLDNNIFSAPSR